MRRILFEDGSRKAYEQELIRFILCLFASFKILSSDGWSACR